MNNISGDNPQGCGPGSKKNTRGVGGGGHLFMLLLSAASLASLSFFCVILPSIETSLPLYSGDSDYDDYQVGNAITPESSSREDASSSMHGHLWESQYIPEEHRHRRLLAMPYDPPGQTETTTNMNTNMNNAAAASSATTNENSHQLQYGQTVPGPSVLINMLRRAKDIVSENDVPFLLQIPHTSSETLYNIMTQCYGLVGQQYQSASELESARGSNAVDGNYVSSHDRPASMFRNFGQRFHFLATPHYQEGAALLTKKHRGRMIVMMRHPTEIAEIVYATRPGSVHGDIDGLVRHVNSTDYYDNWMTRMLANVPKDVAVTEEHFREARMVLENKFLIGMTSNMAETVQKRLGLYFGWKELPNKQGCETDHIKKGQMSLPPSSLIEGSHEWRFVRMKNHFDMKLFVRSMSVFGNQKVRAFL